MTLFAVWSAQLFMRAEQQRLMVRHTEEVLSANASALAHLQDAETGERGYLITRDRRQLEPYRMGRDSAALELARLGLLTADNDRQQRTLAGLKPVVARRLVFLDTVIFLLDQGKADSAMGVVQAGRGIALMDSARHLFKQIRSEEHRLLEERAENERASQELLKWVLATAVVLSAMLSYFVSTRFSRHAARHAAVSTELSRRNDILQEQALEIELTNQQLQEQQLELEMSTDQLREQATTLTHTTGELRQANAAKNMFLANMSHELRTPLNAIAGHVQLMEMEVHGSVTEPQRVALDRIARAQRHLLALINDILNFAKLDAGKLAYSIEETDLCVVMRDVTSMVETQLTAAGLKFDNTLADEPCMVMADAEKLRQVLINLLGNAAKFTPSGGRVAFHIDEVDSDAKNIALCVSDTGIGIPVDKIEQIFDPFVQLSSLNHGPNQGSGLGLAISRELARGMGGDLTVTSSVGVGSVFCLTLKRARGAPDRRTPRHSHLSVPVLE
ncbi:MAG: CHASE3 domain-containing protein [Gemmatimonadaceae bacterium]